MRGMYLGFVDDDQMAIPPPARRGRWRRHSMWATTCPKPRSPRSWIQALLYNLSCTSAKRVQIYGYPHRPVRSLTLKGDATYTLRSAQYYCTFLPRESHGNHHTPCVLYVFRPCFAAVQCVGTARRTQSGNGGVDEASTGGPRG